MMNLQKYNKEIQALKTLKFQQSLHPVIKEQIKERIFSIIQEPVPFFPEDQTIKMSQSSGKSFWRYSAAIAAGLLLCAGTAFASYTSLPGSPLYIVKQARENLETTLALTPQAKAEVAAQHAQTRLTELAKIEQRYPNSQLEANTEITAKTSVREAVANLTHIRSQLRSQGQFKAAGFLI
jgi:hypothetical protein